jgi:nucleoside-diphosphate-sugar epimerase
MARVLLIGCGDLGTAVAVPLQQAGHEVIGVRKSAQSLPLSMRTLQADVSDFGTLEALSPLQPDILIYCVSANASTDDSYYRDYVLGFRNVLDTQRANSKLKHVFFVSSTRVYGHNNAECLDDTSAVSPADFGGQRLLEAEQLLSTLKCGGTALRLSGIYGPGRLYLVNMARDLTRWPAQNHWTNRIHRDDAAAFIAYLVQRVLANDCLQSSYIVTDNHPCPIYDVLLWMARRMGMEIEHIIPPEPAGGKRLSNRGMLSTGFELNYPSYQQGYAPLLTT